MKVIIVGGSGTIGRAVAKEMGLRHRVIVAAHRHGDVHVDITDIASIEKMYKSIGEFDAVIATTGKIQFAELSAMTSEDYFYGLKDKLMGQVNLVLIGKKYINDSGSFTLTSGILSHDPVKFGSSGSMVNSAINGFVIGAAIEMPRAIRINAVSPTILEESMQAFGHCFHGFHPVPASRVALAYSKSVEGLQTGQIYSVG
ncbi:MAG: short chain dehydrogenase [Gammaproteobacteria bacterium 39-13]|nr:short chain dehydrogenase [Gammaproteobacteria bacterium]OJV93074.1 MAG: short chain dehydrogenase [Gammaproteobacteria bacterium 39-13]